MNEYFDIINLNHYELRYHPHMSMDDRAAQFAPFDALVGYKEEINEKKRLTDSRKVLLNDELENIDLKFKLLEKNKKLIVTYFLPDTYKLGGKYVKYSGILKRADNVSKELIFTDKKRIRIEQIISVENI